MALTFTSHIDGHQAILSVAGEIDVATAPEFCYRIAVLIESDAPEIVVDMTGVAFCDSSVLSVLVVTRKRLRSEGRSLRVTNPSDRVRKIFDMTGLTEAFGVSGTVIST